MNQASSLVKLPCQDAIGYLAVYRICFVVTIFFALMAILMIGVRSSRDPRGHIQNGFWGIKFLLIFAGWVGAFFIPHGTFGPVMMWIGMFGGMAFILVQLVSTKYLVIFKIVLHLQLQFFDIKGLDCGLCSHMG